LKFRVANYTASPAHPGNVVAIMPDCHCLKALIVHSCRVFWLAAIALWFTPASALAGPPQTFDKLLTPDGYAVNNLQPPYQPSGDPRYSNAFDFVQR